MCITKLLRFHGPYDLRYAAVPIAVLVRVLRCAVFVITELVLSGGRSLLLAFVNTSAIDRVGYTVEPVARMCRFEAGRIDPPKRVAQRIAVAVDNPGDLVIQRIRLRIPPPARPVCTS